MTQSATALEAEADRAAAAGDARSAVRLLRQLTEQEDRPGTWLKLSAMLRATGDLSSALAAVDRALSLAPLDFSALLSRAVLLEKVGDARAGEAFAIAVAHAPDAEQVPPALVSALAHARAKASEFELAKEQRLAARIPAGLAARPSARLKRFVTNTSRRTRHYHQEPTHFHYPEMPEIEVYGPAEFPELADLERSTDVIRTEFEQLMAAEAAEMVPYIQYPERVPLRQWKELNNNTRWTAIHLLRNGEIVEANARHCPRTLEQLANLPQPRIPGASPNAMFSLLAPRTKIPPHTGVANIRLVGHLPLIVPPNCRFRVGATSLEWQVGQTFVFDDTIEHEAWNDSDELRVVLIFDLWVPALDPAEREALARIIPAAGVAFSGDL